MHVRIGKGADSRSGELRSPVLDVRVLPKGSVSGVRSPDAAVPTRSRQRVSARGVAEPIVKSAADLRLPPNLPTGRAPCRRPSSGLTPAQRSTGSPAGGLNIAHEAVDRHRSGLARSRRLPLAPPGWRAAGGHLRRARTALQPLRERARRPRHRQGRRRVRARRPDPGALRRRARNAEEPRASSVRSSPPSGRSRSGRGWRSAERGSSSRRSCSTSARWPGIRDALPDLEHVIVVGEGGRADGRPRHARLRRPDRHASTSSTIGATDSGGSRAPPLHERDDGHAKGRRPRARGGRRAPRTGTLRSTSTRRTSSGARPTPAGSPARRTGSSRRSRTA